MRRLHPAFILAGLMLFQIVTHLAWLPISAHSGQVAIPYMMNHGKTLFGDLLEQHAPATSFIMAVALRLLPIEPILVTRLANILAIIVLTRLIYGIAWHLTERGSSSLLAAGVWVVLEPVYGNVLFYFDTLLAVFVLLGLWLWLISRKYQNSLWLPLMAGLVLGSATLAKQHAWGAVVFFIGWLIFTDIGSQRRRQVAVFVMGTIIMPLVVVVIVALQGNLANYIYWNWTFNLSGLMDSQNPTGDLIRKLVFSNALVPAFALLAYQHRKWEWGLVVLLWAACLATLFPRFGLDQTMAHLPLACLIAGIILDELRLQMADWSLQKGKIEHTIFIGIAVSALAFIGWTCGVVFIPNPLGRAGTPAYDEFKPLITVLNRVSQPEDTVFILPETDSTPQIHVMSGLLPPGTWIKGWSWYFKAPSIVDNLLREWETVPPTFMVVFPNFVNAGQPGIAPLITFTEKHYQMVESVDDILFHGNAIIYRYNR